MAEQSAHDDHQLPKDIRSKLLRFDGDHTIDEFRYGELPADKKQIRLLRLLPGVLDNPQVDCEMFEAEFIQFKEKHKLVKVTKPPIAKPETKRQAKSHQSVKSSNPPTAYSWWLQQLPPAKEQPEKDTREIIHYEALSWRWGDETHGPYAVMILKDGALYKKKVSETLGLAMKYLRSETKERIIWIDAICINQNDHEERSSQVAMMSLLYSGADQVCVWIGDDDEESKIAIKFIANEINQLKNFDRLCTDREHASKWRALLGLMQRAWFSRRWVVQEIALAPNATVYCGPDEIPWHELAIAVELFVEVETATHRLSELMKKDDKFLIPNWFEHISELGASLLVNATARIFREYREGHGESSPKHVQPRRSLLSLEYLVTSLSIFDCGRPHDSVYALVAIARDAAPFPPTSITERTKEALIAEVFSNELEQKPYPLDYNLPYADVCKDFTLFCIQRCADTDPVQALDILCRPWAKDWRPGEFIPHDPPTEPKKERLMQQQTPDDVLKNYWKEVTENPELGVRSASIVRRWFPTREAQDAAKERRDSAEAVNDPDKTKWHGKRKRQKVHHLPEDAVPEIQELGLPSWVARITGAPFDIFPHPGMDMVKMGRKNADPLVGIPQDGHRNYSAGQSNEVDLKTLKFRRRARLGHYSLYVNGFRFDKVAEVAQVSQAGQIPASWLDMAKWEKARRPKSMDADPGDPPDEFWRTLVADRGRHDRNPPYYYARACKETIMKGGLRSNAVDTGALIYNERNSIIAEFCRRVQAVIWNRALIRTEKGILGLASEHVRKGDLICIIYGCTVPIILRKGNLKTAKERHMESIEDSVEAMHRVMRRCEKFRARKAHYMKKSEEEKQQIRKDLSQHKDEILHAEPNHFASRRKSWYNKRRAQSADRQEEDEEAQGGEYIPGSEDNSSEDDSEESESDSDDSDDGAKEMENGVDKAGDKVNGVANDNSGAEGPDSPVNKESRQKKANQRDPYRHYEFLGQAYIHGMMDGEAVRQKFYANKPDHVFEIR